LIVDLNLDNKHVVVLGGGTEGVRKVRGLLGQNCKITVISNHLSRYLIKLEEEGEINTVKTQIKDAGILENYKNVFLLLASTNNKTLNRELVERGRAMGSFVYASDDPRYSDFSYTSIINIEGIIQVAVSTFGKSPIMARRIRIKLEKLLNKAIKKTDIQNAKLQEFARTAAKEKLKTVAERKEFLYSLIHDKHIQNLIKEDRFQEAKSATLVLLENQENKINK
jgi:precorrin-2 dehydrogenase/sirohydrochlorin ferrochelatase